MNLLWPPRAWPTALGLAVLWPVAKLPIRWWPSISTGMGACLQRLAPARKRVVLRNISLAFPSRSDQWQSELCDKSYKALALSVLETAKLWFCDPKWMDEYVDLQGLEHLQCCQEQGQAVLLVSCHYTSVEVAGAALCRSVPFNPVYAAAKNPYFDAFQRHKRLRFAPDVVVRSNMRKAMRVLRSGGILWLLPDQSVASSHGAVATSFFGQPVLSSTAASRLQKSSAAQLLVFDLCRGADGRLVLRIKPPLDVDVDADETLRAQQLNDVFEALITRSPADYFWHHKRFKSEIPGVNPYG